MTPASRAGPCDRAFRQLGDPRAHPNVRWVSALTGATEAEVRAALHDVENHLEILAEIRERHREGGRQSYAQIRAPFELYAMARLLRPSSIVETGVSSGVSSAHFLLALSDNRRGRLRSIDLPTLQKGAELSPSESPVSLPPGRPTGWAVPARLRKRWELNLGPSQELLPTVATASDPIGLFLHDSLHTPHHLTFELETIRPHLAPGAVVLADNTKWTGTAFDRFAASLGAPVLPRGRSDLVGLRVPTYDRPASGRGRGPRSRTTR
ncbi:MAG: class I SAM-dependent methyltransferase [Thermoplasmata archaeon]|nr:class I SAM-dependent methyltransferase [Thermoplasmata archaeon]